MPPEPTYNPILARQRLRPLRFSNVHKVRWWPDVALVLFRRGAPPKVLDPRNWLTLGEAVWGGYSHVVRVDLRPHQLEMKRLLPCRGGGHDFQATVRFTCKVVDPGAVVDGNVTDVGARVGRRIFEQMRRISHVHGVDDTVRAEEAILRSLEPETFDPLFRIEALSVELGPDDAVRELLRTDLGVKFYQQLLQQGTDALVALQLHNSKDVGAADRMQAQHKREAFDLRREEEEHLLERSVVDSDQLEELGLERLRRLEPELDQAVLPASTRVRQFPPEPLDEPQGD